MSNQSAGSCGHDQTVNPAMDADLRPHHHAWWREDHSCAKADPATASNASAGHTTSDTIISHAIAFGHGARVAYASLKKWGTEVEHMLEGDWKSASHEGQSTWETARAFVKQGWDCCGTDDAAPPKSEKTELPQP